MECCWNEINNIIFYSKTDNCCIQRQDFKNNYCIDYRVKFGVPLDQVCKRDIPGPLLVSYKANLNQKTSKM